MFNADRNIQEDRDFPPRKKSKKGLGILRMCVMYERGTDSQCLNIAAPDLISRKAGRQKKRAETKLHQEYEIDLSGSLEKKKATPAPQFPEFPTCAVFPRPPFFPCCLEITWTCMYLKSTQCLYDTKRDRHVQLSRRVSHICFVCTHTKQGRIECRRFRLVYV